MPETDDEKTARVTMIWPEDLKERVRREVGGRGLTSFVLDAVRAKLAAQPVSEPVEEEGEDTYLGPAADDDHAGQFLPGRSKVARVRGKFVPVEDVDLLAAADPDEKPRPIQDVQLPAVGDPGTIRSEEEDLSANDDLLERVRAIAASKGVDLSGAGLRPASTVLVEREDLAVPLSPEPEIAVEPEVTATRIPVPHACPNCGSELVAGECWECM